MRRNLFNAVVVLTLGIAGGMMGSAALASRAYQSPRKTEQTVAVTGSARKRIRSDLAVWQIHVSGEGKDLKAAYQVLKDSYARVSSFLEAKKFKPEEIAVSAIGTTTLHARDKEGQELPENLGYTLTRTFTVTSPRVDGIALPASEVTELIQDGVKVVSEAPQYIYTGLSELKIEMIGEATKDARARAEQIVTNAGCVIAEVKTAHMGVLQITPPNSTSVSDSGLNDTTTIEKDVTSVVSLTLGLAQK